MTSKLRVVADEMSSEQVAADGLRASHDVMESLEKCKSSSESIIDTLPDIFAIITAEGRILKGNFEAARCLNTDIQSLVGTDISSLFHGGAVDIFKSKIDSFPEGAVEVTFELPVSTHSERSTEYFWTISTFDQVSKRRGQLFRILGRDISEIRAFEKKLTQIFTAIPLGIITITEGGEVEWPYSQYSEYLLGNPEIHGKDVEEVLFKPVWDSLDSVEKMGAGQLIKAIGSDPMWFELSKLHFPREICRQETSNGEFWLGISYHPIIQDNIVEKIMIILEDRSDVVKARKAMEVQRHIEDGRVKRILEVQDCSGALLEVTFHDYDHLIPRLNQGVETKDASLVSRALHALKGVSRTAGFTVMKNAVHDAEEGVVLNLDHPEQINWKKVKSDCDAISKEAEELRSVCFALTGRSNSLEVSHEDFQVLSHTLNELVERAGKEYEIKIKSIMSRLGVSEFAEPQSFKDFDSKLQEIADKVAEKNNSKATLEVNWYGAAASVNDMSTYKDIFSNLVLNAMEHGVEPAKERKGKNKPEAGKISIKAVKHQDGIEFIVQDDGRGVDTEQVIKIGKENRFINRRKKHISREDVFKVLQQPGFTTNPFASHGEEGSRGLGLSTVVESVKSLGGQEIKISSHKDKGTVISFKLPLNMVHFES